MPNFLGSLFFQREEAGRSDLPLLSLVDKEGIIPQEDSNRKNNASEDLSRYLRVAPGDIAYNTMRMWEGRSALSKLEGIVSPAYTICRPASQTNSLFFSFYFKTAPMIAEFARYSQGLVKDTLSLKFEAFARISAATPCDPAEQQRIAECLSSVDEVIAAQARKLDALKAHKKGLMQQLFPREGETKPRLRFPEFRKAKEWEVRRLGDIADVAASGDVDTATFSPECSEEHRFPVYSNAVEKEGLYGFSSVGCYPAMSITITARGTLGRAFVRSTNFVGIGRLIVVSNFAGETDPHFLKECWGHLAIIPQEVTSIPQLTAVAARSTPLPFPTPAEQHRIAMCLSSLDALIVAETRKHDALKRHKRGLMQQLFPSQKADEA